ncbi:cadmium resistance transporter [Nocardia sp. NPDC049190]|uniref:cadmium resistance transporter n=1 Tax=Nocardia sp. NPDC049190 TaxID=3155650 RepID=UPI0033D33AA6
MVVTSVRILISALFFGHTATRVKAIRLVIGRYLGFAAIVAAAVVGALGVGLLPESAIPYLGLLPLLLGARAGWKAWREHGDSTEEDQLRDGGEGPGIVQVAAVTLANGGDNIGVYVPVFAVAGVTGMAVYVVVFLLGVALWCVAGRYFDTRPLIAKALSKWGHVLMSIVLIGIGALILTEGGVFGL